MLYSHAYIPTCFDVGRATSSKSVGYFLIYITISLRSHTCTYFLFRLNRGINPGLAAYMLYITTDYAYVVSLQYSAQPGDHWCLPSRNRHWLAVHPWPRQGGMHKVPRMTKGVPLLTVMQQDQGMDGQLSKGFCGMQSGIHALNSTTSQLNCRRPQA